MLRKRKDGNSHKTKTFYMVLIVFIFTILVTSAMQAAIGEGSGKDPDGNGSQDEGDNGDCNQTQQKQQDQQQEGDCNQSQEKEQEQEQERQQNCTGNCTCDGNMYRYRWQNTQRYCFSKSSGNGGNGSGNGNQWRQKHQNEIQAGVENGSVVMETTFMQRERYMLQENNHYKIGMEIELLEVKGNRVRVRISAEFQEGKVAVINIDENVLKFGKSGESNVYFDGEQISKGALEEVIAGESTEAKYVGEVGEGGAQFLVYIPHFSEHIIEIESLLNR